MNLEGLLAYKERFLEEHPVKFYELILHELKSRIDSGETHQELLKFITQSFPCNQNNFDLLKVVYPQEANKDLKGKMGWFSDDLRLLEVATTETSPATLLDVRPDSALPFLSSWKSYYKYFYPKED